MAQRMTINYEKKPCYDIVFTNSFDLLAEELQALGIAAMLSRQARRIRRWIRLRISIRH